MSHYKPCPLFCVLSSIFFAFFSLTVNAQYCASNSTSTADSKIDRVRLTGETVSINQNSAGPCESYTDNTALPAADLMVGNAYTVDITLGTCGGNYSKSATVFIDLNMDNDFDDAGENLGNTGFTSSTATLSVSFTVGSCGTPLLGTTRMRVVGREGGTPTPCGTYTWGETEDYTVEIIANPSPSAPNQFYLVGDAVQTSTQCIQLTAASNGQLGMAWDVQNTLDFSASFSYDFTVNFGSNNGGADGIMFIIQNDPDLHCVSPSGGWGAGNISNSLIIEMDTYLNTEDRDDGLPGVLCSGGAEPDHMDIWINGSINPFGSCGVSPGARIIPAAIPTLDGGANHNIENGLDHTLRISWVPGGTMTASLMNAAATTTYATVTHSFDPLVLFGTNTPIYGISGSTGGLNNQQSFCIPAILLNNTIVEFDARLNQNKEVDINWAAFSSNNGDWFSVEKSYDFLFFEELTNTATQGPLDEVNYYHVIDEYPFPGVTYYRLKFHDINGGYTYSDIRAVEYLRENNNINIYPNPARDIATVELAYVSEINIELYNQLGQPIFVPVLYSDRKAVLDISILAAGIYVVQVETEQSSRKAFRIVKN